MAVRSLAGWPIGLVIVGKLDYALFILATRYVAVAVAAAMLECWPVVTVAAMALLFRGRGRYASMGPGLWAALVVCFADAALCALSQHGGLGGDGPLAGVALGGVAATAAGSYNALNCAAARIWQPGCPG